MRLQHWSHSSNPSHLAHSVLLAVVMAFFCSACHPNPHLVLYTSQDQVYAEPILREFTQQTGIEVRAVFDSESVKTAGLANRLRAEATHPQCDVFWSNEEMLTHALAREGILETPVATMGHRSRRLAFNTNLVALSALPASLSLLTNSTWQGKVALAYPLFGTTASHFVGLRQKWGDARWQEWCRNLVRNKVFIVDGNSMVAKLVGRGEAWIGLTDSDDIAAGQREGLPIAAMPLSDEFVLIPNTIGVVRGSSQGDAARRFIEFLTQEKTLNELVAAPALGAAVVPAPVQFPSLQIDWEKGSHDLAGAFEAMKQIFLR